jgi:glycosyltransferase involved in cell wall biosynthesis
MKIHYTGQQGGPFGWGTFGAAMAREFQRAGVWAERDSADVIFQPLADNNFTPSAPLGKRNVAMSFFEFALGPDAKANADKFETVFVGSTWCQQRCAEAGILNTRVLIQGVDGDIFKPQPPREPDGTIRIFSGGKFEYRKGHDLVIAAFREFVKVHPEAHLVCAWFNPWPALFKTMAHTKVISPLAHGATQPEFFRSLMRNNGITDSQFTILPQLSHADLAREMAHTDFGIFPNRCEGGNNLVMQEYLATGKLAVANTATGHWDMRCEDILEIPFTKDENHWAVQTVDDIVRSMIHAASDHEPLELPSAWRWTWEAAARTVLDALS